MLPLQWPLDKPVGPLFGLIMNVGGSIPWWPTTPLRGPGWFRKASWTSMRCKPLSMFFSGLWFSSCCQVLTLFEFLPWLLQRWTSRKVCSLEVQAKWAPYLFKLPLFMVIFITSETQLGHRLKEWFYISTAGWTKECIGVIYRCMNNLWAAPPPKSLLLT